MGVKVRIAEMFQQATNGVKEVQVDGNTIGECLKKVIVKYPTLEKMWYDEKDKVSRELLVFVNLESTHKDGLAEPVKDGDEIYPLIMIGGG
jgi:molybdopterin converting factor small subunit